MKINFTKMDGTGNDFVLIDQKLNREFVPTPDIIIKLCNRRRGIGADGLLYIKEINDFDFELEYYNSDGSLGSLCGNGARCSIKYVHENFDKIDDEINFICNSQIYSGKIISASEIKFNLNQADEIELNKVIEVDGKNITVHSVNTGSPHAVIFLEEMKKFSQENFKNFPVVEFGRKIRNFEKYFPEGTNVNFIEIFNDSLNIRTYERGVENETLACGTGSVASAIIANLVQNSKIPLKLKTRGGDTLEVNFEKNNQIFTKITLTGPAKINYIGTFEI